MEDTEASKKPNTTLFIDLVMKLHERYHDIDKALNEAEAVFKRAGIELANANSTKKPYECRGRPPRGSRVRLLEHWDVTRWAPSTSWEEAQREALVTSIRDIPGKTDRQSGQKLLCFNVRPLQKPQSSFLYAPLRLYLNEEGIKWRWWSE